MAVAAGAKLGRYEIISRLGEGGMGEVYRARDSRLNRSVAVKVLPQDMVSDPDRMRRFDQEARTVAALNHPNILAAYDVGVEGDTPYLVMELLEGETLRERLDRGPLPIRKAVEIALQIAQGLAAAHERGIVHRDLKPENVFVTRDGHTKLLDFGLAKARAQTAAASAQSGRLSDLALTAQTMQTEPGVVMGTAPYMAPEQVRGEQVDYRADIFSFGAVLYEMVCGKRAFPGDTSVEIMTAILKAEAPEFDAEQVKVPPGLERIVRHCLEKNPADRFQSDRDLTFALAALSGSQTTSTLAPAPSADRRIPAWWAALAALLLVAVVGSAIYFSDRTIASSPMEFAIPVQGEVGHIALSSDGSMLAYVAMDETSGANVLYIQPVGSPNATRLDGTEGSTYPFWSPSNDAIGFFAQGKLKKVSATGGAPRILANVLQARGGSWSKKGVIVYAPDACGPLWRVDADGAGAAPLTNGTFAVRESSHRWPVFLPDGDRLLFWSGDVHERSDATTIGIYATTLSDPQHKQMLLVAHSSLGYADGHIFYVDDKGSLVYVGLDRNLKVHGKPHIVANQVGHHPSTHWAAFSVALNGTVVYHKRTGSSLSQLAWYDRSGKELGRVGDVGMVANPNLSPDGDRVVLDISDPLERNIDVWIEDLKRGASTRFTFDPEEETTGVWSRDGKMIAYRWAGSPEVLRLKNSNGFEADRPMAKGLPGSDDMAPNSFAPGDQQLLATAQGDSGGLSLALVSINDKSSAPFLAGKNNKADGQISPDGKWVAYESDETGEWEVYISPFPSGGGKLQVSRGGGKEPRWREDGKEIFYLDPKGYIVSVKVDSQGSLSTSNPTPLFQARAREAVSSSDFFSYNVTPDGQRFLVDRYVKPPQNPPISIILHAVSPD